MMTSRWTTLWSRRINACLGAVGVAAFSLLAVTPAWGWPGVEVFPGVTYEHRSGPQDYGSGAQGQEIYIAYIDTTHPRVSLIATRPSQSPSTVSAFAAKAGTSVAINTHFFGGSYQPCGMAMGAGELFSNVYQNPSTGACADSVAVGPERLVRFLNTNGKATGPAPNGAHEVITGMPMLVVDGNVVPESNFSKPPSPSHMKSAHPRTAICMHQDGKTMIFAVVDGRAKGRTGMRGITLARFMKGLGCYQAVNLDGGGSTTMYIQGQPPYPGRPDGVVNRTSDGKERTVCCHLGVVIGPELPPVEPAPEPMPEPMPEPAPEAGPSTESGIDSANTADTMADTSLNHDVFVTHDSSLDTSAQPADSWISTIDRYADHDADTDGSHSWHSPNNQAASGCTCCIIASTSTARCPVLKGYYTAAIALLFGLWMHRKRLTASRTRSSIAKSIR